MNGTLDPGGGKPVHLMVKGGTRSRCGMVDVEMGQGPVYGTDDPVTCGHCLRYAKPARKRRCLFCGKSKEVVKCMVAGPGSARICNECAAEAHGICEAHIEEKAQEGDIEAWRREVPERIMAFAESQEIETPSMTEDRR